MSSTATAAAAHDDHHGPAYLQHHFDTPAQQFDAAKLGMWVFLAQEILFFSGLFVVYGVFRSWYPSAFSVGSHLLNWKWGGLNTCVLLLSSFTAAMAVKCSQEGKRSQTGTYLLITLLCAGGFMVIKYIEYSHKFHIGILPGQHFAPTAEGWEEILGAVRSAHVASADGGPIGAPYHLRSFFGIYFVMTGLHGLHVVIGIGLIFWIWLRNRKGEFSSVYYTPVDITALYWHLVDLFWIYLFPLLYLID
jgi:cytochrome c oxidase subunit 3